MGKRWKRLRLARKAAARRIDEALSAGSTDETTTAAPVEVAPEVLSAPEEVKTTETTTPKRRKTKKTTKSTKSTTRKSTKRSKTRKTTPTTTQPTT